MSLSLAEVVQLPGWLADVLPEWAEQVLAYALRPAHLTVLGVASAVMFLASVIGLPWAITRLPADYFAERRERLTLTELGRSRKHPGLFLLRNLLGVVLLLCGVAMLFLPGQGLLTIVVALLCLDFPGKVRVQRKIVSRPSVLRALNAIRRRAGRDPFELHDGDGDCDGDGDGELGGGNEATGEERQSR